VRKLSLAIALLFAVAGGALIALASQREAVLTMPV
jgi:hypothetical protein